ncbi:MAG TPA: DUF255 domain-containing protein [Vicinamibacterales bacterium]|nr:DUF255 domain-containing protein [Vicinamibacterales bacterium]
MVRWLPWDAEAFARAAREGKPVLLSITAAWCRACHEMDRTTYADPAVAALIHERFVPVRVDTDRRPDINERYNLGGWPTTAFLTASGALITGGTFVPVERMTGVLTQVAAAVARVADSGGRPAEGERPAASGERTADGGDPAAASGDLIDAIFAAFDEEHGGFGIEPKFPHTAPLHLAMGLFHETGDERWRLVVRRTLDAMAEGGLWDRARGGFYRYATTRDWQLPHQEKLLETNASLLRVYAEAAAEWNDPADAARTRAIATFITTVLRAEAGGYHGSDAEAVFYVDSNAAAAGALLRAAAALDDSDLAREALASFERVLLLCYRPALGVAHYFDGSARVRGLLADHVAAIAALLDAHDLSGLEPYRMMAEELGHLVVRDMRDERTGGFFDRAATPEDVGLLRARRQPFVGNADAALAFARLSRLEPRKGFPDPGAFRDHAGGALAAAARQLDGQGPLAAHYALARRLLID